MKDFFGRQDTARSKTAQLIILFSLSVMVLILCTYLVSVVIFHLSRNYYSEESIPFALWNPFLFIAVFIVSLIVILGGTAYRINELRHGGRVIAKMLGGRWIPRNTRSPEERLLYNVVEEMAIASGMPVPDLYIMDKERGINAFAAGFGPNDSVISVTKGTLLLLDRNELQGVVAHEFSHILNSDTLINVRMMGWLHGILMVSYSGRGIMRFAGHARGGPAFLLLVLGFALYVLGGLGLFFGTLIKSALSRQREYLADAAAVQFTRDPSGLAGALKKIGGLASGSKISHPRVSEVSHMYFSEGVGASMATHPPLRDRIKRLDPLFRGAFPRVEALPVPGPPAVERKSSAGTSQTKAEKQKQKGKFHPVITGSAAAAILGTVGTPMKSHMEKAKNLIDDIPESLRGSIMDSPGARALIYALLLDPDQEIRDKQMKTLQSMEKELIVREAQKLWEYRGMLPDRARLPLVDLAMPALRSLPRHEYDTFKSCVKKLISSDGDVSFFEYVLSRLVIRRLEDRFFPPKKRAVQIYRVRGAETECSIVLTLLARLGSRDEKTAEKAFAEGEKILRAPGVELELLSLTDYSVKDLNTALQRLSVTSPLVKKKILAACLKCLTFDREITVEEVELFRVIAEFLDCPVPPWVSGSALKKMQNSPESAL